MVATNLQFSGSTLDFLAPGHILILMSSLCWGIDNNLITYASERIDVVKFVVYRSSIVGPVLLLLSYLSSTFPPNASELGKIFLIGLVIFGGAMYTNFLALKWLGAIRSTLIFPISSLFGLVAAYSDPARGDWVLPDRLGWNNLYRNLPDDEDGKREKRV